MVRVELKFYYSSNRGRVASYLLKNKDISIISADKSDTRSYHILDFLADDVTMAKEIAAQILENYPNTRVKMKKLGAFEEWIYKEILRWN